MERYDISGMSCAACSARVEKAVRAVPGVSACEVNLLTNSMGVEGTADEKSIVAAVEAAGYGAAKKGAKQSGAASDAAALADRETPRMKKRLFVSLALLAVLMYGSMGHHMWGWPLPAFLSGNPVSLAIAQLLLAAAVTVVNQRFFTSGFRALINGAPNMDTLVSLGAGAAFGYSLYALFAMSAAMADGGRAAALPWLDELYFESAAMILTLITVGKTLEARAKGKTTDALRALMALSPKTATVLRDGQEKEIPIAELRRGDVFLVRPGGAIPADGRILEGKTAVDESALTGESIPIDKSEGDAVSAATVNTHGFIRCEAERVGEDTTLSQIVRMVSDASAGKAPIARAADRASGVFVPAVLGIAALTAVIWLALGKGAGFALARAISVLVISCPCALGLATPVAIMVGSGVGARHGILFKTAAALEAAGHIRTVALDKTGTVTAGKARVTGVYPAEGESEASFLRLCAALEARSEHPLAEAVREKAAELRIEAPEAADFEALPGNGLRATLGGRRLVGGSLRYLAELIELPETARTLALRLADEGNTPLCFAEDGVYKGMIAVADTVKEDAAEAVRALRELGTRVVMLTGDNERTARAIAAKAGIEELRAGLLPADKSEAVRALQAEARTAMVGDGINDAPALTAASLGIAIGAGTDVALDAADVVLVKSRLADVPAALRLGRAVLRNIRENLFWAFFYNVIGIPVAAGALSRFGLTLSPMLGAAAMSLSSFCVVTNALRLNRLKLHGNRAQKMENQSADAPKKEEKTMKKIMKIEGMMCMHCEARVKKTLEGVDGVLSAEVSHTAGTAVVLLAREIGDETLKAAVEAQDYRVTAIETAN